jgi:hypothetical protein
LKLPIITPTITYAAARFQAGYQGSHPQTSRSTRDHVTKHQSERLKFYQQAFDLLISVFANYREPMQKVKEGYDNILTNIRRDWVEFAWKSQKLRRSMSTFRSIVAERQDQYEKKRLDLISFTELTREQITALKKEIEMVTTQVETMRFLDTHIDFSTSHTCLSIHPHIYKPPG